MPRRANLNESLEEDIEEEGYKPDPYLVGNVNVDRAREWWNNSRHGNYQYVIGHRPVSFLSRLVLRPREAVSL